MTATSLVFAAVTGVRSPVYSSTDHPAPGIGALNPVAASRERIESTLFMIDSWLSGRACERRSFEVLAISGGGKL